MNSYEEQAIAVFKKHGITMKVGSPKYGPVDWDKGYDHYTFPVTLRKDGKSMRTMFTQSRVGGSTPPTEYDIVSCLTKADPGSFEDFCSEFGYDTDSRSTEKTYRVVKKTYRVVKREWEKVARVFGADSECLEDLCNVEAGIGIRIR